jgi:hypothetical protein
MDLRLEHRLERARELAAHDGAERRAARGAQIRRVAVDPLFPLAAAEQAGRTVSVRLDGLHPLVADVSHPQRHPVSAQRVLGGIEIDRHQIFFLRAPIAMQRAQALEPADRARRDFEFQLDFLAHGWNRRSARVI